MFSILQPPKGVWTQFTKNILLEIGWNAKIYTEISCLATSTPLGRAFSNITKKFLMDITWNVQNCMKLMFSDFPHHQSVWELGSSAQNNSVSCTKILVSSHQPLPTGTLASMSFLCRFGHFTKFLVRWKMMDIAKTWGSHFDSYKWCYTTSGKTHQFAPDNWPSEPSHYQHTI